MVPSPGMYRYHRIFQACARACEYLYQGGRCCTRRTRMRAGWGIHMRYCPDWILKEANWGYLLAPYGGGKSETVQRTAWFFSGASVTSSVNGACRQRNRLRKSHSPAVAGMEQHPGDPMPHGVTPASTRSQGQVSVLPLVPAITISEAVGSAENLWYDCGTW